MATIHLPPDFKEFFRYLNSHKVEYLLVGGYAVGYYGFPRATMDIDVCLISLEDLKISKAAAGRHKDLTDLEQLP